MAGVRLIDQREGANSTNPLLDTKIFYSKSESF